MKKYSDYILLILLSINWLMALTIKTTNQDIVINTDYYTAIIAKKTGMVESLKLNGSDFELISDYPSYSLFFVEYMYQHNNSVDYHFDCPADWDAEITTKIIHQNSNSVFIRVLFQPGYINSEWYYLFEDGKPWFNATITRTVETAGVYSNFQQCTMYNSDVDNSFIINYDGDIELTMGGYDGNYSWVSPYLDGVNYSTRTAQHSLWTQFDYGNGKFFPTIAWSDNETGICMGATITNTSPNQRESISYHGGGSTQKHPGFAEAQWNWFGKSDSESLFLKRGVQFSMNLIFYQNKSHIDSLFSFVESLKSEFYEWTKPTEYSIASWGGNSSPLEHYNWRFPQVSNNFINSQELWRHKGIAFPRSQIGTHDSQLFSLDMYYLSPTGKVNVSPIYGLTPLFTDIENRFTDSTSTGIMHWNESGIDSELSFTAYNNDNHIKVKGNIEKQANGEYFLELSLSPRTTGYFYQPSNKLLTIYSIDTLLDTVAITSHFVGGIDTLVLKDDNKLHVYINATSPSFECNLVSSIGKAIYSLEDFRYWSTVDIPSYRDNYIQFRSGLYSIKASEDYLIGQTDSLNFSIYVTNTFSQLHLNKQNNYNSAQIEIDGTVIISPIINTNNGYQLINFPFMEDRIYTISFTNELPNIQSIEFFSILKYFPNPAKKLLNLELFVMKPQSIDIRLFNLLGEECQLNKYDCSSGINMLKLDTNYLPSGTYIVQINGKNTNHSKLFTIIH